MPGPSATDAASGAHARDGRSTRWDPHRRARRLTIIRAAISAIEEHGPDALTGQIAQYAGVPRTHVYRHFDGKPALDLAVSTYVANELGERIRGGLAAGGTAREIIHAAIDQHLTWVADHPNLYRFLAQNAYAVRPPAGAPDVHDAKSALARELTQLVDQYLRALGLDHGATERMIVGVVGLVDATAAWWIDRRTPGRAELAGELTEQVWLIIERAGRQLGLRLSGDEPLPPL